jgi:hypothetical protein
MSTGDQNPAHTTPSGVLCLIWLTLFGLIGYLILTIVLMAVHTWYDRQELRQSRTLMAEQIEQIERGRLNCLVIPDPRLLDDVLTDVARTAKIRDVYLGRDLSDPQWGRLRELANLKSVVVLCGQNSESFLEHLRGMASIEELTLECTPVSRPGIGHFAGFPKLKSLCFPIARLESADLMGLNHHPSIERLCLTRAEPDEGLFPILQTLPRLHGVTIQTVWGKKEAKAFEARLRKALPKCECSVRGEE